MFHGGYTLKKYREKDQYSYRTEMIDGKQQFIVSFIDGGGKLNEVAISSETFHALQELKLAENRQAYLTELYVSHFISSENDEEISSMAFYPLISTEDYLWATALTEYVSKIITELPDIQRRRFIMHYVDGLTTREIALIERCSFVAVSYSIQIARRKIEEQIKKFQFQT